MFPSRISGCLGFQRLNFQCLSIHMWHIMIDRVIAELCVLNIMKRRSGVFQWT